MPSSLISYTGLSDATSTYSIDFGTNEDPIKYYLYIENGRAEFTTIERSEQDHAACLKSNARSIIFYPFVDAHLRTDEWCLPDEECLKPGGYFSTVEPSIAVYLRPDDEIQMGQIRMKIRREDLELSGHVGEIQVKSSGQADISLGSEEQQLKIEKSDSPIVADPPISTPNPQVSHDNRTIESVVETPAASSRYQQPPINLSPILPSIADNAIKGNKNSESWGSDPNNREIMSKLKKIAEPHARASSLGVSMEPKIDDENAAPVETEIEVDKNIVDLYSESHDEGSVSAIEPGKMIETSHNDLQPKSPIHNGVSNDDTQNSTHERGDRLLKAAVASQERVSNPSPSSPIDEPSITNPNILDLTTTVLDVGLETPRSVRNKNLARNELKRKRDDDDSHGSMRSIIHVEIPMAAPASAIKSVSKKRKTNPVTPAQSSKGALAKKQKSNLITPTPAEKSKSAESQNIESFRESVEPSSSSRSTRSSSIAMGARILYASSTTVDKQTKLMNFLGKQKIRKAKSVADCDFLCVGKGELKKTSNLVMAAVSGKQVINDDWVVQSAAEGELLDFSNFLARDAVREAEWGISLDEAIQRGKDGIKPFAGLNFHFSPAAKKELGKGYSELKDIAILAGATSVQATLPKKSNQSPDHSSNSIIITAHNDRDLGALAAGGWRCYSKDIMTLSVLRGRLDVDSDEYLISGQEGED